MKMRQCSPRLPMTVNRPSLKCKSGSMASRAAGSSHLRRPAAKVTSKARASTAARTGKMRIMMGCRKGDGSARTKEDRQTQAARYTSCSGARGAAPAGRRGVFRRCAHPGAIIEHERNAKGQPAAGRPPGAGRGQQGPPRPRPTGLPAEAPMLVSVATLLSAAKPTPNMPVLWATLALVGILLAGALVIEVVKRWRDRVQRQERQSAGDQ